MNVMIEQRIEEFVRRVSGDDEAREFVFVRGYPARNVPNPIDRYTVAVTTVRAEAENAADNISATVCELYTVRLLLRIYAPAKTSGSSLLSSSEALMRAVRRADTGGNIAGIVLEQVQYETAMRVLYRDIVLTMSYMLTQGEVHSRTFAVSIDGSELPGVCSMDTRRVRSGYDVLEYLSSSPVDTVSAADEYDITLSVYSALDTFAPDGSFTLTVTEGGYVYVYSGCTLRQQTRRSGSSMTAKNTYQIHAKSMIRRVYDEP